MKTKHASQTAPARSWKNAILLAITALALSTSSAFGATTKWILDGTDSWFVAGNWDNGEPDATTDAQINIGGAYISANAPMAEARSLTLGINAGDSGSVEVIPFFGDLRIVEAIFVGYRGTGTLTQTFGTITSATASIASMVGSNGAATVDGGGSTWAVSGELDVGGTTTSVGETGLLTVSNGGTVSAGTSVHVWNSGTLAGNGTVNINSGSGTAIFDGTLAPKGEGATLTVVGNLQLDGGSATQRKVTPQDPSTTPQVSVSAQVSLAGRLSVTMTGDFSSAPTRFTLLSTNTFDADHRKFDFQSITYPTDQCWYPVITYDYSGGHVYLDRLNNCNQ